jgi:3-deoxy-manno-octulosonate cytidylyltransferase (CMP-KDO synthetase)
LQLAEDLEQLKVLENGYKIKIAVVDQVSIGVDHPEDIQKVEQWLCKQNIYL